LVFRVTAEAHLGSASAVTVSAWTRRLSFWLLALLLVSAGTTHFLHPAVFVPIVPPAIPWPVTAVYVSGAAELGLGLALLVPRLSRVAALGVCVFLVAVFPANVYHWLSGMAVGGMPAPRWYHPVRLPLQGLLIVWAYWLWRGAQPPEAEPARPG
jgi:uncharacterized membrane protein